MSSIDNSELFEQYYQKEYDFNTESLSEDEIYKIKKLVREKREDYGNAPMGTGIFDWIQKNNSNIRFELVGFPSDSIDGALLVPNTEKEKAYIILNSEKPLVNQIFASAHEYYHYICDYRRIKNEPQFCNFRALKDINEKKASRFAAELLLPESALRDEVNRHCRDNGVKKADDLTFTSLAILIILLTIKYQMPIKAIVYRIYEEGYIHSIDEITGNLGFIKDIVQAVKIYSKRVCELYSTENNYITSDNSIYENMKKAFSDGNTSREDLLSDAAKLNLDMIIIDEIIKNSQEDSDTAVKPCSLFPFIKDALRSCSAGQSLTEEVEDIKKYGTSQGRRKDC